MTFVTNCSLCTHDSEIFHVVIVSEYMRKKMTPFRIAVENGT